jgi:hypothetical protein
LSIGGGFSAGLFNRVRSMDGLAMMGRSDSESSDREGRQTQTRQSPLAHPIAHIETHNSPLGLQIDLLQLSLRYDP